MSADAQTSALLAKPFAFSLNPDRVVVY